MVHPDHRRELARDRGGVMAPRIGRTVLDSLADPLHQRIVALTAAELSAARAELAELSATNCGWFLYRCRELLRDVINEWLNDRLGATGCLQCGGDASIYSDGIAVCSKCSARRQPSEAELAELHAAADRKWCR